MARFERGRATDRLLVDPHQPRDAFHPGGDPAAEGRDRGVLELVGLGLLSAAARGRGVGRPAPPATWLTRLDLPEPETPVTVVNTPIGKATSRRLQVVASDAGEAQPALSASRGVRARAGRLVRRTGSAASATLTRSQTLGRAAVENLAALFAGGGSDVDDPVGVAHDVEFVLDHEQRVARRLQLIERRQQRFGVGRMQTRGRLVQHVDHAEQVGANLRREPQPLQFAGRKGRRAALQRQVAEAEVEKALRAAPDRSWAMRRVTSRFFRMVCCAASPSCVAVPSAYGRYVAASSLQRQPRQLGDIEAGEFHGQRFGPQALAMAQRALAAQHVLQHTLLHQRALGVGERVQHVRRALVERALVARLVLALQCAARLLRREAGVDRHDRLLVGEEDPVAILLRKLTPGPIDVDSPAMTRISRWFCPPQAVGHAAMARSRIVSESSGTMDFSVTS